MYNINYYNVHKSYNSHKQSYRFNALFRRLEFLIAREKCWCCGLKNDLFYFRLYPPREFNFHQRNFNGNYSIIATQDIASTGGLRGKHIGCPTCCAILSTLSIFYSHKFILTNCLDKSSYFNLDTNKNNYHLYYLNE